MGFYTPALKPASTNLQNGLVNLLQAMIRYILKGEYNICNGHIG